MKSFFKPKSVAVVGVSLNPKKLGSLILQNITESGFKGSVFGVNPKLSGKTINKTPIYNSVADIPKAVDLLIISIPANFVKAVIGDAVKNKAKNIIIISAGFKETGNEALEAEIFDLCTNHRIRLLGPNCLGAIFPEVALNASFADGMPLKGSTCFISQSGAFCTAALDWSLQTNVGFSHFISLGNKADINEADIINELSDNPKVKTFALYLESVADGKAFIQAITKARKHGKKVLILEPGESKKAHLASSSHTGSLAPNFRIMQTVYEEAGAIQVYSMQTLFHLIQILNYHHDPAGKKIGILTNAGGVGVLSTDLAEKYGLDLVTPSKKLITALEKVLPAEAGLTNPIDIIGDARHDRYEQALEIMIKSDEFDQIIILLTPQRTTEIAETSDAIIRLHQKYKTPLYPCFIGGERTSEGLDIFENYQIPCFKYPDPLLKALGVLVRHEKQTTLTQRPLLKPNFTGIIADHQAKELPSLDQTETKKILDHYHIDTPATIQTLKLNEALAFQKKHVKASLVLKICSPFALHKTEMKGVFLNINNSTQLKKAWSHLEDAIKTHKIKEAEIMVQEQIKDAHEIFIGVHTDPHFGRVMVFGSGGIYTELIKDTALCTFHHFAPESLINQTKVAQIIQGYRGKKPLARKALVTVMNQIYDFVQAHPGISSLDINPLLLTEDRAVVVDAKILV